LSSLFDNLITVEEPRQPSAPVAGEIREIGGRECVWTPKDPTDHFSEDAWVPVDGGAIFEPVHKPATDPDYAFIKKHEYEFRKRTMAMIEAEGGKPFKVDRYNHRAERSFDLWGIFDTCALMPGGKMLFANQTSKSALGTHVTKMLSALPVSSKDKSKRRDHLRKVLEMGAIVRLYGFYKSGRNWACEVREVTLATMDSKRKGQGR
jgi:hypothetical protein